MPSPELLKTSTKRRPFSCSISTVLTVLTCIAFATFVQYFLTTRKMPPKAPLNPRNFPRPPLLERTDRHLQIKWDDVLIMDTKEAYWVLETTHPPSMSSVSAPMSSFSIDGLCSLLCPSFIHSLYPYKVITLLFLRMERTRNILEHCSSK
jgi:hypothetical protein